MDADSVIIRNLSLNDLSQTIRLSENEGWNQTEKDWKLLIENPLNTCIAAEHDNNIIGTATSLNHAGKVAWIGMVIVDKQFRGQGIGRTLLLNLIERLHDVESIKLDATPAGQPLYHKIGFLEEYKIFRMINSCLNDYIENESYDKSIHIDIAGLQDVLRLDKMIFGTDRSYLLQTLYEYYPGKGHMLIKNNKLAGYILGRDGRQFNYLGPACAFSSEVARILISKSLKQLVNLPVVIDVLNDKEDMILWLESLGFVKQRHFVRMYLKNNEFCGRAENQYLISGPEFG